MSEVSLQVGGRTWRVACAPGEEDRVQRLGATVAEKLAGMGKAVTADAQNMLFAALLLADELHEGRDGVANAKNEIEAARREADSAANRATALKDKVAQLEGELAGLQRAQQAADAELERVRAERSALNEKMAGHEAETARLQGAVDRLQAELETARAAPPPPVPAGFAADDAAPALERFAEMLEECADKLEARAATP